MEVGTLQLLEENMGNAPQEVEVGKDFLERASAQELRTTLDKWALIKPKSYTAKIKLKTLQNGRESLPAPHLAED